MVLGKYRHKHQFYRTESRNSTKQIWSIDFQNAYKENSMKKAVFTIKGIGTIGHSEAKK